jgi:hypothetical protein
VQAALFLVVQLLDEEGAYGLGADSGRYVAWMSRSDGDLTGHELYASAAGGDMERQLRDHYTDVMNRLRRRDETRARAARLRLLFRVAIGGLFIVAAGATLAIIVWSLVRTDSSPSTNEVADALNADARTFATSCRAAGDDVFHCQATARDGRVTRYRVVIGPCWLAHPATPTVQAATRGPARCLAH